jgi:hypothetical protein
MEQADEPYTKPARVKEAWLVAYRLTGNVTEACKAAHVARCTAYGWRESDPEFAAAWEEANEIAIDALEAAARQRALDSSDQLMMFLLRANRPDKYNDTTRVDVRLGRLSDDDLVARAAEAAARLARLRAGIDPPGLTAGGDGESGGEPVEE